MLNVLAHTTPARSWSAIARMREPFSVQTPADKPYGVLLAFSTASAGVWTEKGSRILKMVGALRAGVVWANTFNRFDPTSPFGGYKESGYGREGGKHGLAAYLKGHSA